MSDQIWLNMQDLEEVNAGVKAAVAEFTSVAETNDDAEEAVGNPDGRGRLRGRVHDFEGDWNDNRDKLTESLTKVQEHLQAIIDGFHELDTELAAQLTPDQREQLGNPGPDNQPV